MNGQSAFGPFNAGLADSGQYQQNQQKQDAYQAALMSAQCGARMYSGSKPLVVCGGVVTEAKDLDDAQRIAEEQAHQKSADAYILKPVKRVAPKRDVVTTDL